MSEHQVHKLIRSDSFEHLMVTKCNKYKKSSKGFGEKSLFSHMYIGKKYLDISHLQTVSKKSSWTENLGS